MALEACSFGRWLSFKNCVWEESPTLTAVLAGMGIATDQLFVSLVDGVDGIMMRSKTAATGCSLRCFMVADDIRFVAEGLEDIVDVVLGSAWQQLGYRVIGH